MDAFGGHLLAKLEGHKGLERRRLDAQQTMEPSRGCSGEEVSWTPDSKFVVSGSLDGKICVWDVSNLERKEGPVNVKAEVRPLQPFTTLEGHPGPTRCVKFNPRLAMMASAGAELVSTVLLCGIPLLSGFLQAFWLPDPNADPDEVAKELLKKK